MNRGRPTYTESPPCYHLGCFGNSGGKCKILTSSDFGKRDCPFEKPARQVTMEQRKSMKRVRDVK